MTVAVFLASLLGFMAFGMPIAFALILTAAVLMWYLDFWDVQLLAQNLLAGADSFPLLAQRLVDSLSWLLVAGASLLSALGAWHQVQFGWGNVSTVVGYPVVLAMLPVLASMLVLAILAVVQLVNLWRHTPQRALAQAHVE